MKKIITILSLFLGLVSFGQVTTNPDTVCINSVGEQYFVTNTPGSSYSWTTTGTLASGQGTNAITIDWGGTAGLYPNAVSVTETTISGCPGNPVNLDVYIMDLVLLGAGTYCITDPTFTLFANEVGGTFTGNGVVGNDFDPSLAGTGTHIITYSLSGCSQTMNIIVDNIPVTGPIQHY
tara:strand:- start:1816 stop:2349 length:534 start_codon:yes stop_codon:yes gene_type:complete